jgi:GTP cyclohydrolase I
LKIRQILIDKGVETPILISPFPENITSFSNISEYFNMIMAELNLDLTDDSLKGTPDRVSKMFIHELFEGLDYGNFSCGNCFQ